MGTALEVLGLSLPYSASIPATFPGEIKVDRSSYDPILILSTEKAKECYKAAKYLKNLMELDIKPKYPSDSK
jgi:dihydroxy-acid dehydratase